MQTSKNDIDFYENISPLKFAGSKVFVNCTGPIYSLNAVTSLHFSLRDIERRWRRELSVMRSFLSAWDENIPQEIITLTLSSFSASSQQNLLQRRRAAFKKKVQSIFYRPQHIKSYEYGCLSVSISNIMYCGLKKNVFNVKGQTCVHSLSCWVSVMNYIKLLWLKWIHTNLSLMSSFNMHIWRHNMCLLNKLYSMAYYLFY